MAYRLSNVQVIDDVTWPWKVKLVTPIRLERNISKTTWAIDFKFGMQFSTGNAERAHKSFSLKVGVALVTWPLQFFAYDRTYPQNYLS